MVRRRFLQNAAVAGVISSLFPHKTLKAQQVQRSFPEKVNGKGFNILFQGDSITDGGRSRNSDWNHVLGHGFAYLIASKLSYDFPERDLRFLNRGISGNRIPDLAARWQADTIDLQPDLLNILVGINDSSGFLDGKTPTSPENFEKGYRELLQQTKAALPFTTIVLCEPFVLPGGRITERLADYKKDMALRQQSVKKLANEFKAIHVAMQQPFDEALALAPVPYWVWDGVHPMPAGHELMARQWIDTVGKQLPLLAAK